MNERKLSTRIVIEGEWPIEAVSMLMQRIALTTPISGRMSIELTAAPEYEDDEK